MKLENNETLLPCPFCNEQPSSQKYPGDKNWTVQCVNGHTETLDAMVWNTRPNNPKVADEGKLAEMLSKMEDECYARAGYMGTRRILSVGYAKHIIANMGEWYK
jgi:hypothetical protein